MKFKKGDKVQFNEGTSGSRPSRVSSDYIFTVACHHSGSKFVHLSGNWSGGECLKHDGTWIVEAEYLTKVTKGAKPPKKVSKKTPKKFKVGDRVRIIPGSRFAKQSAADGVITKLDATSKGWHRAEFDDGRVNVYEVGDLELATSGKSKSGSDFNVGDKVTFKDITKEKRMIPDFYSEPDDIPGEKIKHGSTMVGESYFTKFAVITDTHESYFIVEYVSERNKKVRLGFDKKNLKKVGGSPEKKVHLDLKKLDALVIAPEIKEEIVAVLSQHKHQELIFKKWGLDEVIEYGKGMTFLFWGGPGTGKTWAATCMAKALGQEIITIGMAEIQTSEPGGAARNIQSAFASAKEEKKILFIDECDSLIFNRANLGMILGAEVNTLLTEIEKSEGVVILATNRVEEMDEALERRISLIIEFPTPNREQRREIWERLIPKKMPLALDKKELINELADHEITGGLIKNVILQAARLATLEEKKGWTLKKAKVKKEHFVRAIKRVESSQNLMGTSGNRFNNDMSVGISNTKSKLKKILGS